MTTFEDGPAEGQRLMLSRGPIFLRVVKDDKGVWDALDQLEDNPEANEKLFAYQVHGGVGTAFIDGRDRNGRRWGNRMIIATYRFVPDQPTDAEMRSSLGWQKWCKEEATRQNLSV